MLRYRMSQLQCMPVANDCQALFAVKHKLFISNDLRSILANAYNAIATTATSSKCSREINDAAIAMRVG